MRSLRHSDRHVVAVDMPGFGKAAHLQPGPVLPQLDDFVAAVIRDVAEQAGRDVVVIGNSLGGIETLRAAADPNLPIAGIVPISPAGFGHSRAIKTAERYALRHDGTLPILSRGRLPMPVVRGVMNVTFRTAACARPRRADRHVVRAFAGQFRDREDIRRILSCAPMVLAELDASPPPATDVPVLLLWGERDRLTLHRGAHRVRDALPQTEFVALHGLGHCPHLEAAPLVAKLIARFVDSLESPTTVPPIAPQREEQQ
jgi:pimeloyl-ACP methyl ester carboxylesterase